VFLGRIVLLSLRRHILFRVNHILLSFALAGLVLAGGANPKSGKHSGHGHGHGHVRQDRAQNGDYSAVVGGCYAGGGTAAVTDDKVTITATITARDGVTGQFSATDMLLDGPYFNGTGTAMGHEVKIYGRVDAPRASRLVATFFVSDGHPGRIVAKLPSDPGDDGWTHDKDAIVTPG